MLPLKLYKSLCNRKSTLTKEWRKSFIVCLGTSSIDSKKILFVRQSLGAHQNIFSWNSFGIWNQRLYLLTIFFPASQLQVLWFQCLVLVMVTKCTPSFPLCLQRHYPFFQKYSKQQQSSLGFSSLSTITILLSLFFLPFFF